MGDFIILAVIAAVCFFAVRSLVKNRKKGSSCSCGCSGCAKKDLCHPIKKDSEK